MDDHPFGGAGREFERAMEAHARHLRAVMERAHGHLDKEFGRVRAELERIRGEFDRMMDELHDVPRTTDWLEDLKAGREVRSPRRRRPPGGEAVPVEPRPKPTPLVGGAEAPIE